MRYKVGDRVIEGDKINLLFNPYHKKDARERCIHEVLEANDKYFSIYEPSDRYASVIKEGLSCGMNEYMIFHQDTGYSKNWAGRTRYLHLKHDKELIRGMIISVGKTQYDEDFNRITKEIKYRQELLKQIKSRYVEDLDANLSLIDNQPMIEPQVTRGEWVFRCIAGEDPYLCSVCGNTVDVYGYSYCPNCGAYMEGEDNG